jgi:hypothetical protein
LGRTAASVGPATLASRSGERLRCARRNVADAKPARHNASRDKQSRRASSKTAAECLTELLKDANAHVRVGAAQAILKAACVYADAAEVEARLFQVTLQRGRPSIILASEAVCRKVLGHPAVMVTEWDEAQKVKENMRMQRGRTGL